MNTNAEKTTITETAAVAEQGTRVEPEPATMTKGASTKKNAPRAKKGAKEAKPAAKNATGKKAGKKAHDAKPTSAREGSKKQIVVELLSRKNGATLAEIMDATGWQKHSVRGFISGTLTKKMDFPVASLKNDKGERFYRIEK
jgi:hypothetical protein